MILILRDFSEHSPRAWFWSLLTVLLSEENLKASLVMEPSLAAYGILERKY